MRLGRLLQQTLPHLNPLLNIALTLVFAGEFEIATKLDHFILGEKPFQCDLCGRSFRQSGNLTKHLKSHENAHLRWNRATSDKPYKCPHEGCDKSFTAKSSLQNHIRTHTNETGQTTTSVESSAEQSGHYRTAPGQHIKMQSEKQQQQQQLRYHCIHPNCRKSFKDEVELRAHLIAYNPGMAAENEFMRDSVLALLNYVTSLSKDAPAAHEEVSCCVSL